MDIWSILKEAIIFVIFCPVTYSEEDFLTFFRPNPSLPHELNEFFASIQKYKNDFRSIREIAKRKKKNYVYDAEKRYPSNINQDYEKRNRANELDNQNSVQEIILNSRPVNDIYPHMYQKPKNLNRSNKFRQRRNLKKTVYVGNYGKSGENNIEAAKYPDRYRKRSNEIQKNENREMLILNPAKDTRVDNLRKYNDIQSLNSASEEENKKVEENTETGSEILKKLLDTNAKANEQNDEYNARVRLLNDNLKRENKVTKNEQKDNYPDMSGYWTKNEKQQIRKGIERAQSQESEEKAKSIMMALNLKSKEDRSSTESCEKGFEQVKSMTLDNCNDKDDNSKTNKVPVILVHEENQENLTTEDVNSMNEFLNNRLNVLNQNKIKEKIVDQENVDNSKLSESDTTIKDDADKISTDPMYASIILTPQDDKPVVVGWVNQKGSPSSSFKNFYESIVNREKQITDKSVNQEIEPNQIFYNKPIQQNIPESNFDSIVTDSSNIMSNPLFYTPEKKIYQQNVDEITDNPEISQQFLDTNNNPKYLSKRMDFNKIPPRIFYKYHRLQPPVRQRKSTAILKAGTKGKGINPDAIFLVPETKVNLPDNNVLYALSKEEYNKLMELKNANKLENRRSDVDYEYQENRNKQFVPVSYRRRQLKNIDIDELIAGTVERTLNTMLPVAQSNKNEENRIIFDLNPLKSNKIKEHTTEINDYPEKEEYYDQNLGDEHKDDEDKNIELNSNQKFKETIQSRINNLLRPLQHFQLIKLGRTNNQEKLTNRGMYLDKINDVTFVPTSFENMWGKISDKNFKLDVNPVKAKLKVNPLKNFESENNDNIILSNLTTNNDDDCFNTTSNEPNFEPESKISEQNLKYLLPNDIARSQNMNFEEQPNSSKKFVDIENEFELNKEQLPTNNDNTYDTDSSPKLGQVIKLTKQCTSNPKLAKLTKTGIEKKAAAEGDYQEEEDFDNCKSKNIKLTKTTKNKLAHPDTKNEHLEEYSDEDIQPEDLKEEENDMKPLQNRDANSENDDFVKAPFSELINDNVAVHTNHRTKFKEKFKNPTEKSKRPKPDVQLQLEKDILHVRTEKAVAEDIDWKDFPRQNDDLDENAEFHHFPKHAPDEKSRREQLNKRSLIKPQSLLDTNFTVGVYTEGSVTVNGADVPTKFDSTTSTSFSNITEAEIFEKNKNVAVRESVTNSYKISTILPIIIEEEVNTEQPKCQEEKFDELLNLELSKKIVKSMSETIGNNAKLKKKFSINLSEHSIQQESCNNSKSKNELNQSQEIALAKKLLDSVSKIMHNLDDSLSNVRNKLTNNCLALSSTLKQYLDALVNIPKCNDVLQKAKEIEDADIEEPSQSDFLFKDHGDHSLGLPEPQSSKDTVPNKIHLLEDLLKQYEKLPDKCKERAKPVKEYIQQHLDILKDMNSETNAEQVTEAALMENVLPPIKNDNNPQINQQLEDVSLGTNQEELHPNFNLKEPTKTLTDNFNIDMLKRELDRNLPTKNFQKLFNAVQRKRQLRESERKLAEVFGNIKKRSVGTIKSKNKELQEFSQAKYESPLVYSVK